MIGDFIEVNNLSARIISFPSDTSIMHAAKEAHISESSLAKALPFVDDKMDFYVLIAPLGEKISIEDGESIFGVPLSEIENKEVLDFSGFEKKYFPPIGVFGAKVAFHSSMENKKTLFFSLSAREFLIISKEDIIKSAELNE